ncbi:OstA-like protein [Zhouia sp. PK063]|uniref:OstA-like protein n=1 Tax=Zhouia sp. PK063 TaxID=3373602 RepID=UPI0037A6F18C
MRTRFIVTYLFLFLNLAVGFAQQTPSENTGKKINIIYDGHLDINEEKYPGATIMSKDNRQVQFEHQGADLWCDVAVLYKKENVIKAYGNVFFQQGDSIKMNSGYLEYNGNTKMAFAKEDVELRNNNTQLFTEQLNFDRNSQQAYYNNFGTVKDSVNTLTSKEGRYFINAKKYQFLSDVTINNPKYILNSAQLDYYEVSKHAYLYGPSTITGEKYKVYCERGYYDTSNENGYFVKNSRIDYDDRIIHGDSLYFDQRRDFASATNNIKVLDTVNNSVIKGHYAEVWKAKDSLFVTKRAVAIGLVENDSVYIHGDTLMVTGKENERIIRAFKNARFYKKDLSGKCDSIYSDEKTGITKFITTIPTGPLVTDEERVKSSPILWSGKSQMTGDSIQLISNSKTQKLDSLKVLNNAFIMQKDSLSDDGYNQIKGLDLYGKFVDNNLQTIDIIKNAEVIYYLWDKDKFIGIDKKKSGNIRITFENNEIEVITPYIEVNGKIYPDKDIKKNERKLIGAVWRGNEIMHSKDDIFDEDDNNIKLVKIRGLEDSLNIDQEEAEKSGYTIPENTESDNNSSQQSQPAKPLPTPLQKATPNTKAVLPTIKKDTSKTKKIPSKE